MENVYLLRDISYTVVVVPKLKTLVRQRRSFETMALGKAAMTWLNKIWRDKYITITTKWQIVNALVFPAVMYNWCESWTIRKAERIIID